MVDGRVNRIAPRINFGMKSVFIFGKTENGKWFYFVTIYNNSGEPAGPIFWAFPGAEEKVINHIKEQLANYHADLE